MVVLGGLGWSWGALGQKLVGLWYLLKGFIEVSKEEKRQYKTNTCGEGTLAFGALGAMGGLDYMGGQLMLF